MEKILKKAIDNGWDKVVMGRLFGDEELEALNNWEAYFIIFSHGFAKAFWKDCGHVIHACISKMVVAGEEDKTIDLECWQYHLQQMVLEPEPLKYLEKFL